MDFEIQNSELNNNYCYDFINQVPVIDTSKLTYNDFFQDHMLKNIPCVIKNVTNQWEASLFWLETSKPNFSYLLNKYGDKKVTIYNCNERYFNSQKTHESVFAEYLKYWENYDESNNLSLAYLKDWHLKLLDETDQFYKVPIYFASDWLNEYYTTCLEDDYRFVYMGIKNTWTPFHADVFTSYSWSANVCGKKKWLLFPPNEENYLKDNLGNLPYDVSQQQSSAKCFEVIQNAGEVIFVPSGWYHQVSNLEDTISINHNWVNGCNIKNMLTSMITNLKAVCLEIEDCKDMENYEEHCQVMLNASFGMDYCKFYDFVKYIGLSRINMLERHGSKTLFHGHRIGYNHILFDLKAIRNVLEIFIYCDDVNNLPYFINVDVKPYVLLKSIVKILDNIEGDF